MGASRLVPRRGASQWRPGYGGPQASEPIPPQRGLARDHGAPYLTPTREDGGMDYVTATKTLRVHRPTHWYRLLLGRRTRCRACGLHWTCPTAERAMAYKDRIDPPQLPGWTLGRAR
jgi:hypothetical protein